MPFWLMQLLANGGHLGYWEEVGDGTGGSSGESSNAGDATGDDSGDDDATGGAKTTEAEAKLLKEVMKKKAKIKELEDATGQLKQQLAQFDGINPDEIRQLLKDRADAEKSRLEAQGNWNALKEQMAKEHHAEKERLQQQIVELQAQSKQFQSVIERLTLTHQFDASKFILDELVLTPRKAKAVYGAHFDIADDGRVVGYDKPQGEAGRTMLVDAAGEALPFDEALKRLIEADPDRDELLKAKRRAGASSSSTSGKQQPARPKLYGHQKIQAGLDELQKK